jgi:hypothetical protein
VDQLKCEWILSKPNALSGALAGLRGDDLTAGEGARRRSSSSKACPPSLAWNRDPAGAATLTTFSSLIVSFVLVGPRTAGTALEVGDLVAKRGNCSLQLGYHFKLTYDQALQLGM